MVLTRGQEINEKNQPRFVKANGPSKCSLFHSPQLILAKLVCPTRGHLIRNRLWWFARSCLMSVCLASDASLAFSLPVHSRCLYALRCNCSERASWTLAHAVPGSSLAGVASLGLEPVSLLQSQIPTCIVALALKFLAVFLSPVSFGVGTCLPTEYWGCGYAFKPDMSSYRVSGSSRVWSHALRSAPPATPRVSRVVQLHERRQPEGSARRQSRRNSQAFTVRVCEKEDGFASYSATHSHLFSSRLPEPARCSIALYRLIRP